LGTAGGGAPEWRSRGLTEVLTRRIMIKDGLEIKKKNRKIKKGKNV